MGNSLGKIFGKVKKKLGMPKYIMCTYKCSSKICEVEPRNQNLRTLQYSCHLVRLYMNSTCTNHC